MIGTEVPPPRGMTGGEDSVRETRPEELVSAAHRLDDIVVKECAGIRSRKTAEFPTTLP